MPISDEIIELAPVKKTKTTLIILFAVMGVLLAAAVAFLVLFVTKEGKVDNPVSVDGVAITESTTLFSTTDEQGNPLTTASVGNEYTVHATINFKGKVDLDKYNVNTAVTWKIVCDGKVLNPTDVFSVFSSGVSESQPSANADGNSKSDSVQHITYYFTFKPNSVYTGKQITITAVSQEKTSKSDEISFTVVDQATEHIFFTNYSISGGRAEPITGNKLSLPCYADSKNNQEYRVTFEQKGKSGVKSGEYAEISKYDIGSGHSDDVRIITEPANSDVIDFDGGYNYANSRFAFKVRSAGTVDIIVIANVNRDGYVGEEIREVLHIEAKSTSALGIIDGIYFTDKPVNEEFYKANWNNAANGKPLQSTADIKLTNTLSLPYREIGGYNDILKHVVLVPFSLQCDKTSDKAGDKYTLKDGWQNKLNVVSSDKSFCDVTKTWNEQLKYYNYGLGCRKLAAGTQCRITISDTTAGTVVKPCDINLNIVAPNEDISLNFKFGDKTYTDKELEASLDESSASKAIAISQSEEAELIVTYRFKAPAATDVTTMVNNGYISGGYFFSFDNPDFMTVKLNETVVAQGKTQKYEGKDFKIELEKNQTQWYSGTATFSLKVGDRSKIANGFYKLTYNKIGLALTDDDPDISRSIRFKVTEVATSATFVDDDKANKIVTNNGMRAGKFTVKPDQVGGAHECDIYIQNHNRNTVFSDILNIKELIRVDQGEFRIVGDISYNSTEVFSGRSGESYGLLTFKGADPANNGTPARQAALRVTAIADGTSGKEIGVFVVNIFVVNAIDSIKCKTDDPSTPINYSKSNYGKNLTWLIDTITATRTSPATIADLSYAETTFKPMYYFNGSWEYFAEQKIDAEPNNILYGITSNGEFNKVFKYDYNGKRIAAVADPFLVALKCGVTLDELRIEYKTVASEYYIQQEKICYRNYDIVREADEVRLYSDENYVNEVEKDSSGGYAYALNQLEHGTLYATAVINTDDGDIIVQKRSDLSACETAYIIVPVNIGLSSLTGRPYAAVQNAYTEISFDAPPVSNAGENSQIYNGIRLCRVYDQSGISVKITVNNAARPIDSFELCIDQNGTDKLTELDFGKYSDGDSMPYTKTFYIRVVYSEARPGTYVYFEKVSLVLPSYLRLKIEDSSSESSYLEPAAKYEIGEESRSYTDEDGSTKNTIDKDDIIFVQKCTVQLIPEKATYSDGGTEGDVIELSCASKDNKSHAYASVGTGISSVSYTVDGNSYSSANGNTLPINIVLDSATDVKTVKIPFSVVTFADGTEYEYDAVKKTGIRYNISDLAITGGNLAGLNFKPSTVEGDMYLAFTVDLDNIRNINKQPFTVTFTDNASGTARVIELKFTVTVESDIYAMAPSFASFVTTGKSDTQTKPVTIEYNGGAALLQPSTARIDAVTAKVYTYDGNNYNEYIGDIVVSGKNGSFSLTVNNGVLTSTAADGRQLYYLGVTYGKNTVYEPIVITTASEEIALGVDRGDNGDNISVAGAVVNGKAGTARVAVQTKDDSFALAAYAFNRGTLGKSGSAVTYKLYASAADRAADVNAMTGENAIAVIDANGTFKFVKPQKTVSDRYIYYRAYFTDGGRGEKRYIDVDIEYSVAVSSVAIEGVQGVMTGDTLTLYYIGNGLYSQLDLTEFIKVRTAFDGVDIPSETSINVVSKNENKLTVNGMTLYPIGSIEAKVPFEIIVSDGVSSLTAKYYVLIKTIVPPTLTGATEINVVENNDAVISTNIVAYDGLKYEYYVEGFDTNIFTAVKQGASGSEAVKVSVNRESYAFNGTEYALGKTYPVTVGVRYSADGMSATVVGGDAFAVKRNAMLKLKWERYAPEFIVYAEKDGVKTVLGRSDDEGTVSVSYDDGTAYYIGLDNTKVQDAAWYDAAAWKYSASDGNGIVSVGGFDSDNLARIAFNDAFGTAALKVTASAYGNGITVTKNVAFNYGDKTTVSIGVSTDNGASYTPISLTEGAAEVAIDFGTKDASATAARKFRYEIDATGVGITVNVSDVKVMFGGDVRAESVGGNIVRSDAANKFYVIFVAEDVTRFTVSSAVIVGGRTYYKDAITLDLTATAPSLTVTATSDGAAASEILPDKTAKFGVSVADNGFIGNYEVTYAIADGSDVADISADGTLIPKKNNTEDRRIVVGVTVRITDGVFAGMEYTMEKSIVVLGVPLPEMVISASAQQSWNGSATYVDANGTAIDFSREFTLSQVKVGAATYDYAANATYAYAFTAPNGFTTADYSVSGSRLTIKLTNNTRAGGRFELNVTATVGGNVNTGRKIIRTFYIDITPRSVAVNGVSVSARKGSYDVKNAVATAVGSDDSQISSDDEYAVSYALANGNTTVVVGGGNVKLSDLVSVSGSVITLKDNVPADGITVELIPTITMKSGAYAGISFGGVNTSVALDGFAVPTQSVVWKNSEGVNAYPDVNIADIIPSSVMAVGTPVIEVRALSSASYIMVDGDGTANPILSVDKNINVLSASGAAKTVELEFIVSFASSGKEYYGKGSLSVASITPDVTVTLTPAVRTEGGVNYVDLSSGESLSVSMNESHGLDITDVSTGSLGESLSSVASGSSIVISAADVSSSSSTDVKITYNVNGLAYNYSFTVNISPRGDSSAFSVTNETATISKNNEWISYNGNYGTETTYGFVSEWTSSESNRYKIPASLYVRGYSSAVSYTLAYVKVEAYGKDGSLLGSPATYVIDGYSYQTNINLSNISNGLEAHRVKMTFGMSGRASNNSQFIVQYQTKNSSGYASTTSKTYRFTFNNTLPVTLDVNAPDASISQNVVYMANGNTYSSITVKPTRDGYTTNAWYFDKECTQIASGAVLGYSHTVYAKWEKIKYSVKFDYNNGKVGSSTSTTIMQTFDNEYVLPSTNPTRSGYSFAGWYNTSAASGGNVVTSGTKVPVNPVTLYARWTPNDYQVTFVGAGLDDFSNGKTVTFAAKYGILPEPSKLGYTFNGWYTDNGFADDKKVTANTTVSIAANHSLYAKWTPISYNVTLNADGGALGGTGTTAVTYEANYPALSVPTKPGYTFIGWYTAPAGGGEMVADATGANFGNKKVTVAADHTLYAAWQANTYEITFNGADVTPSSITVTYGETYAELGGIATPEKIGYVFVEWRDVRGNVVTKDTKVSITADAALTAVWKAKTYEITLDARNGGANTEITVEFGGKYGVMPTPERIGYVFDGWYTATVSGSRVTSGELVAFDGAGELTYATLYARWTAKTHNVVLITAVGTDITTQNHTVTYSDGRTFGTLPAPVKSGYAFKGWYTASDYATEITSSSIAFDSNGNLLYGALFAKFVPTYKVTLDANGGSFSDGDTKTLTFAYGDAYPTLDAPTNAPDGKRFVGWFTADVGGEMVTEIEFEASSQTLPYSTLYAQWEATDAEEIPEVPPVTGEDNPPAELS